MIALADHHRASTDRSILFFREPNFTFIKNPAQEYPVRLAFSDQGPKNGPLVLIHPPLTGNANLTGERKGASGWWDAVVGLDKAIDTRKQRVICVEALLTPYSSTRAGELPNLAESICVDDTIRLTSKLLKSLGIENIARVVGCSFGSQFALRWANQTEIAVSNITSVSGVVPGEGTEYVQHKLNLLKARTGAQVSESVAKMLKVNAWLPGEVIKSLLLDSGQIIEELNDGKSAEEQKIILIRKFGLFKYLTPNFLKAKGEELVAWLDKNADKYKDSVSPNDLIAMFTQVLDSTYKINPNYGGSFRIISQAEDELFPIADAAKYWKNLLNGRSGTRISTVHDQGTFRGHDFFMAEGFVSV